MQALFGSRLIPGRSLGVGVAALFALSGCALSPQPERAAPADVDSVDIGYGSVEKDHVVGSTSTQRTRDEQVIHARTIADMLAKVPGVVVAQTDGGRLSVRIRGTNSFQGGVEPLWVIDGMVIETGGGIAGINPSTVESVTVLKDAGSTAIYGSRGANGVILVRTKK